MYLSFAIPVCILSKSICLFAIMITSYFYTFFWYIPAVVLCRCPFFPCMTEMTECDLMTLAHNTITNSSGSDTTCVCCEDTKADYDPGLWRGGRALEVKRRFNWSPAFQEVQSSQSKGAEIYHRLWPLDLRYLSTQRAPSSKIMTFLNVLFCFLLQQSSSCFTGAEELVKMTEH